MTASIRDRDGRVRQGTVHGSAAAAARRAANEIPCAIERLTIQTLDSGGYRISGCGVAMTYTCFQDLCSPDERTSDMASTAGARASSSDDVRMRSPRASTWSDDDVRQVFRTIHDSVVACLPPDVDSARLQLQLGARGGVRRVGAAVLPADANACIDALLARGRMGRTVAESRTVFLEFRRGSLGMSGAAPQHVESAPDAPAPGPSEPPPATSASVDATVRAAIDRRAPAILACVEDQALALQVSWTRDGHLDALLRGPRQGTPEEQCVRAVVGALTIPAPGSAGTLVHAVQR